MCILGLTSLYMLKCCTLGIVLYTKVKTDIHIDCIRSSEEIQTVSAVFLFVISDFYSLTLSLHHHMLGEDLQFLPCVVMVVM